MRRVAANRIVVSENETIALGVVGIIGSEVKLVSALDGEQPFTEWLGGTIYLTIDAEGLRRAFHNGNILIEEDCQIG